MRTNTLKTILSKTGFVASTLLAGAGAFAQSAVTLTASPQNTTLPDGQVVPMWGYTCGDSLATPVASVNATCTATSGAQQTGTVWQPPLITVPSGSPLTITLVNNLTIPTLTSGNTAGAPTSIPTSLVIVGQLGGGLGAAPARMASPVHAPQGTTWPSAGTIDQPGDAVFTPPTQADRVRSFGTEVVAAGVTPVAPQVASGSALTWANLRPGTYLIHSGTQPSIQSPMGLYGVLVVTEGTVAAPQAYGTTFDKDVALLFSEIDPMLNKMVDTAVRSAGFSDTAVWNGQAGQCGDPTVHTCYPPAVDYEPAYYLINGVSFDRTNLAASTLAVPPATTAAAGSVLLRFVNAGLRMHVPAVVGSTMTLLAEDGNKLPGLARVQSSVFLAAGKTYDVTISPQYTGTLPTGTYAAATYPVFDRALGLSTANQGDGGMQVYISVAGGPAPAGVGSSASTVALSASDKTYYCVAGNPLVITDPARGVLAGAVGANGAALGTVNLPGSLNFQSNGTFSYAPPAGPATCAGSFTYVVNGQASATHTATIAECDENNHGAAGCVYYNDGTHGGVLTAGNVTFTSNVASRYASSPPGVLKGVTTNPGGLALTAVGLAGVVNADGSFVATPGVGVSAATCPTVPTGTVCRSFPYQAKNSQGTLSNTATATVIFLPASNLLVNVKDAVNGLLINDYRWIIEEDKTFWIDPKCQVNTSGTRTDSNGRPCPALPVESLGYNFHTAHMPVVASGCVGAVSCEASQMLLGAPAVCDVGNGQCRTDAAQKDEVKPGQVYLDPLNRYFISVMPGDGVTSAGGSTQTSAVTDSVTGKLRPFDIAKDCGPYSPGNAHWTPGGSNDCGHAMGGAQIAVAPGAGARPSVNISLQETPLPVAKISVFVFQDDNPLNGENDAGGGVDIIAPLEPGLGGFEIKLFDQAGGLGDNTGQPTYDVFNMPLTNALAGKIDPITGLDACPITTNPDRLVGMIPTCPKFEADGRTLSPLAGQALIDNLYPGLYEVQAYPAADRIARGEEWLQTNTLDGGKPHEAFIKPNEPGYFQEFGPGGFHVSIGFANPQIINARKAAVCVGQPCNASLNVQVTNARMSRTPDQRIWSSGGYDAYSFTQCYVSVGPPDGADFAFEKCDVNGQAHFTGLPKGDFKLTVFDQWNDIMLDGLVSPVTVDGSAQIKEFPVTQWRTNLYTRTYLDTNGDGVSNVDGDGNPTEPGLPLVATNIRYRDGSFGFFNNTDLNGFAGFNEVFPFMNWLVVEADTTRYKPAGTHVVYDAGGPADGTAGGGNSTIAAGFANTIENVPLPANLRVPGARYCANADCPAGDTAGGSTGRVDPPWVGSTQGWQGLLGQSTFMEFGMKPFKAGENGGIKGHVVYASTRPFDDPSLLLQLSWEPLVPNVTINLYQEGTAADGTTTLKLADTAKTTSWDDWAQGFRSDGVPNMNCPGQDPTSPFFATLKDSKQWLDPTKRALPNNSQFKCYDGWSQLNQAQPAPYDGMYKFPSVTGITLTGPNAGRPSVTNCSICTPNPDDGTPMLPPGKYVVEVIVPPGYELVKEEDKNILMGDTYIAPVVQQFAGLGSVFIIPDQAAINAHYNPNNPLIPNTNLGSVTFPRHEGDTGSIETYWPCVGALRVVPDYMSLFPAAGQNAPFAGAKRPLCDRKEVVLEDQMSVLAKFYIFSSTHIAGHFSGTMTNDFASEFDPFSPQFGEKFGPPNLPVAMRDFTGNEVGRVYADQWGLYNGLYFSSWGVNPPNPTGYAPQMSIACMNDPGPVAELTSSGVPTGRMITDPAYNPAYSNFCYETPFMPGFTAYMDTPVIPTQAFADGYNLPDSEYPDATPAIASVIGGSGVAGPWVSAAGQTLTITALGDKVVQNPNFSGPNASTAPYNQKTITRHYGFGARPSTCPTSGNCPNATIGGVPMTNVTTWNDTTISGNVPTISSTLNSATGVGSTCYNVASTTIPAGQTPPPRGATGANLSNYRCGQLVITAANGKSSIDAITVTVAGTTPSVVSPSTTVVPGNFGRIAPSPLQTAIDIASPGDLIIVTPGTYRENLIMWKPVRLQGVGAASVTINADAHPAGKMDQWRRQMSCLFGLTLDGVPNPNNANFDPTGAYTCPPSMYLRADRIPFEGFVGWDSSSNGNLAQLLQEPSLMGAYEGAGITAVGRGIRIPANSPDLWGQVTGAGTFPDGSTYLTSNVSDCAASQPGTDGRDYGTANFKCNPSRIDGVSIINSSQGGGAVFMHGWNHYMEIANTRIFANHGTLTGGINLGNGETPPLFTNDGTICGSGVTPAPLCPPIPPGTATNAAIPFGLNINAHLHHNMIINNASIGDALFSGTPSGAGALTISAGADNYVVDHNWIAANLSTGDGGGVQHAGLSFNGKIANNWILFNQTTNPTLPTSGGGLSITGAQSDRTLPNGTECGTTTDFDCPPGIGDGAGPGLVIDANLIMGNSAESGSGGGLRLQQINGSEVGRFPLQPGQWYGVTVTNNIIANNVAGWDGGGVSMQDALKVSFINNTVVSNDTTASAGVLFKTLGAINSSSPPPGCTPTPDPTNPQNPLCLIPNAPHGPQPAGLVTQAHTPNLVDSLPGDVVCPSGFGYAGGTVILGIPTLNNADCFKVSRPALTNDMFFQNRAFSIDIVGPGAGLKSQQNLVALTPLLNQAKTGDCPAGANYWDVGVRQDDLPLIGAITLTVNNSILTSTSAGVTGSNNVVPTTSPVIAQFCNGARVPPEGGRLAGFNVDPGRSETTGLSPVFTFNNITPAATVDEGHNWLNLTYGPLTLNRATLASPSNAPELMVASASVGTTGGAYSIAGTSPAVNRGTNTGAPATDFFGNPRISDGTVDIGAVEFQTLAGSTLVVANPAPLVFNAVVGTTTTQAVTVSNNGTTPFVFNAGTGTVSGTGLTRITSGAGDCPTAGATTAARTLAAGNLCTLRVQWVAPASTGTTTGSVAIAGSAAVVNAPLTITATAVAATFTATVSPNPLAFGNWKVGATSAMRNLTVTNTGNSPLTGMTYTFGGATQFTASGVATATANMGLGLGTLGYTNGVNVNATNRYATGTPTVTFTPTGCTLNGTTCVAATGTVNMTGTGTSRRVNTITFTPATMGSGFTTPAAVTVSVTCVSPGCVGATPVTPTVASLGVNSVIVTNGGAGYGTTVPGVTFSGGGCGNALCSAGATAVLTAGSVGAINLNTLLGITLRGNYTSVPTVAVDSPSATGCGATLAVGASCTYGVVFKPTSPTTSAGTLTVAGAGATITCAPAACSSPGAVVLSGAGVSGSATVSIAPNPLTITLLSPDVSISGSLSTTGFVTLTNTCTNAATCPSVSVANVAVSQPGGTGLQYLFSLGPQAGPDNCTGAVVAPGGSCTVTVRFTNLVAARGVNRAGTITFTDTATGSPQSAGLIGFATP